MHQDIIKNCKEIISKQKIQDIYCPCSTIFQHHLNHKHHKVHLAVAYIEKTGTSFYTFIIIIGLKLKINNSIITILYELITMYKNIDNLNDSRININLYGFKR